MGLAAAEAEVGAEAVDMAEDTEAEAVEDLEEVLEAEAVVAEDLVSKASIRVSAIL